MYAKFWKRIFDFFLSLLALIILSPLLLVLTVVGAIAMKGNPFFLQKRPGKIDPKTGKERIFTLIKFRTMTNQKDEKGNLLPDDKRLTKYGKFLRSTSLDELPQFWNVVVGDLALVGPRPQLIKDMLFMTDEQRKRHSVTPGITGLAQVSGRNNLTWEDKFDLDLKYINDGIMVKKDFVILLKTIGKVLKKSDIARNGTVSDMDYGEWLLNEGKIDPMKYQQTNDRD